MDENKSGLYIVAIVGVIAVVALVVLVMGTGTKTVSYATPASTASGDAAGQMYAAVGVPGGQTATNLLVAYSGCMTSMVNNMDDSMKANGRLLSAVASICQQYALTQINS